MSTRRSVFFLSGEGDERRFCVLTAPQGEPQGAILYVHPFAEEMNKTRRMAALAAEAFAERGWLVLQMDLEGCGDSSGDFGDASWTGWISDIDVAWHWLRERTQSDIIVWSLRGGSLLVADWLETHSVTAPLLFWQPVTNGHQHLTQFLRLRGVNRMMEEQDAKAAMAAVRAELKAGRPTEVAGYTLSPALVSGLESARLDLPAGFGGRLRVLEVASGERPEPSLAIAALNERWRQRGIDTEVRAVSGTAFWQTVEIATCPALIDASLLVLQGFEHALQ